MRKTRDKSRAQYITVRIERDSGLLERLEEDRKRLSMHYLSEVLVARAADYYNLIERGVMQSGHVTSHAATVTLSEGDLEEERARQMMEAYQQFS